MKSALVCEFDLTLENHLLCLLQRVGKMSIQKVFALLGLIVSPAKDLNQAQQAVFEGMHVW
jgi:hypothetical protein